MLIYIYFMKSMTIDMYTNVYIKSKKCALRYQINRYEN